MGKDAAQPRSAGGMPAGDMASLNGQPGTVVDEMPSGAMKSEAAMTSTAMPEGQPGVEGEMPSDFSAAMAGAQGEMPAGAMVDGRPGVEGDMPTGAMGEAAKMGEEAAPTPPAQKPILEVTGTWRLTLGVSQVRRS